MKFLGKKIQNGHPWDKTAPVLLEDNNLLVKTKLESVFKKYNIFVDFFHLSVAFDIVPESMNVSGIS